MLNNWFSIRFFVELVLAELVLSVLFSIIYQRVGIFQSAFLFVLDRIRTLSVEATVYPHPQTLAHHVELSRTISSGQAAPV